MTEQVDWQRVAEAVALRRAELGYRTQEEAAEAADIGVQTWRQIEGAKQDYYRKSTLAAVCRALDWPPNMLIRIGQGEDPPSQPDATLRRDVQQLHAKIDALTELVRSVVAPSSEDTPSGAS